MREAIDLAKGIIISAGEGVKRGKYICPCCYEHVQLIQSNTYGNYFKHWHGTKRQDCENYRGGISSSHYQSLQSFIEKRTKIALYVSTNITGNKQAWCLELYIPTSLLSKPYMEYILVRDASPAPVRLIPNQSVQHHGIRIKVFPREVYMLEERKNGFTNYETVIGLQSNKLHIFKYGDVGGRILNDNDPLVLGESYIFLVHKNIKLPHVLEDGYKLEYQGDWLAVLFTFPTQLNCREKFNIEKQLNRTITYPSLQISILSPIGYKETAYGGKIIPINGNVILSISGLSGQYIDKVLVIKSGNNNEVSTFRLQGKLPLFVELGRLEGGLYDLFIPNEDASLTISLEPIVVNQPSNIVFEIMDKKSNKIIRLPLYSKEIKTLITQVKKGLKSITRIQIPYPISAKFTVFDREGKQLQKHWDIYTKYKEIWLQHIESEELELLEQIREAIGNDKSFILDAGCFGKLHWESGLARTETGENLIILPRKIKSQIRWLCSIQSRRGACSVPKQHMQLDMQLDIQIEGLAKSDRKLVERLLNVSKRGWDKKYVVYIRYLENYLKKAFKR